MQNNPRCPIPENLPEPDLYEVLRDKGLSTDGDRNELEQRLNNADRSKYSSES